MKKLLSIHKKLKKLSDKDSVLRLKNLSFYSELTNEQRKMVLFYLDKPLSRNFEFKDGIVTGVFGPSYDKSYFVVESDGSVNAYGKPYKD